MGPSLPPSRSFSSLCGALAALAGAAVLLGWAFDVAALKSAFPGAATMKANSALCFGLAGAGLLLLDSRSEALRRTSQAAAWLVLAIAASTLSQDLFGWNARIDELLVRDPGTTEAGAAGRMAPTSAANFVFASVSLLLLRGNEPRGSASAQWLATSVIMVSVLLALGYLFGAAGRYRVWAFYSSAPLTVLVFMVLAAGLLAARPAQGWVGEFTRDTPSARMGRRMIAAVFVTLPALGWLRLKGEQARLYGEEVGVSITAVGGMAILALFALWIARAANRVEEANRKYAERLKILHQIDRGLIANDTAEAVAESALRPLRDALGVPRAVVNLFDYEKGEVEWLVAIGRSRTHVGPGVRYPLALMGDLEALRRGEPQVIYTHALPPSPHKDALLRSGIERYMAVPMVAGGELIGALSFGGAAREFDAEQVAIAKDAATQLAIAVAQARLHAQVRRQAEELELRVQERTAELELANKELASFSYTVSHDLRTPLRAVDGFARIFEEDYGKLVDAEGRRVLGVIRDSSRRMGALIDDLLAFSMLGRQALHPAPLDMGALAAEVWAELGDGAKATCLIAALPPASGDRALLRLVWANLISNALKYSAKRTAPLINVSGRRDESEMVYCVADNGAGFDMRHYGKLFGVFQRLHAEAEFSGTGVGLATVQRIVARHGGRVWAEGEVDAGAHFYFALPADGGPGTVT